MTSNDYLKENMKRLQEQAIFTANALRNMARGVDEYTVRNMRAILRKAMVQHLRSHADDLERAAGVLKE